MTPDEIFQSLFDAACNGPVELRLSCDAGDGVTELTINGETYISMSDETDPVEMLTDVFESFEYDKGQAKKS